MAGAAAVVIWSLLAAITLGFYEAPGIDEPTPYPIDHFLQNLPNLPKGDEEGKWTLESQDPVQPAWIEFRRGDVDCDEDLDVLITISSFDCGMQCSVWWLYIKEGDTFTISDCPIYSGARLPYMGWIEGLGFCGLVTAGCSGASECRVSYVELEGSFEVRRLTEKIEHEPKTYFTQLYEKYFALGELAKWHGDILYDEARYVIDWSRERWKTLR